MPELLAIDLDGTMLDHHGQIPPGHHHAVAELQRAGHAVAIVTGRPLLTARWVHERLGLHSPMVCFNGAWVGAAHGHVLHLATLPAHIVARTLAVCQGIEASICVYPDAHTWMMDRVTSYTAHWEQRYACPIHISLAAIQTFDRPTIKIMVVADPMVIPGLVLRLRDQFAGRCEVVVSQDDRLEIMPAGVTKAFGLARLAAHLGIDRAHVWAVGDADNDVEMLAWAGESCAMGWATPRVRAVARHRLPSALERGLCALPCVVAKITAQRLAR